VLGEYGLTDEQGNEIIMAARAHWFDDEPAGDEARKTRRRPPITRNETLSAGRPQDRPARRSDALPERKCILTARHDGRDLWCAWRFRPMVWFCPIRWRAPPGAAPGSA
jgi:hypothetical protein